MDVGQRAGVQEAGQRAQISTFWNCNYMAKTLNYCVSNGLCHTQMGSICPLLRIPMTRKRSNIDIDLEFPVDNRTVPATIIVDGEEFEAPLQKKKLAHYRMVRAFMVASLEILKPLAERTPKVPGDAYRVLSWLVDHKQFNFVANFSCTRVADDLGIDRSRTRKMLLIIEEVGLAIRVVDSMVTLNPSYTFRGSPSEQNAALEEWERLVREVSRRRRSRISKAALAKVEPSAMAHA